MENFEQILAKGEGGWLPDQHLKKLPFLQKGLPGWD